MPLLGYQIERVQGPCLFNLVLRGKTPPVTLDRLRNLGFAVCIMPDLLWREMVMRAEEVLTDVKAGQLPSQTEGLKVSELFERVGKALEPQAMPPHLEAWLGWLA